MGMGFAPTWLRQVSPLLLHKTTLTTAHKPRQLGVRPTAVGFTLRWLASRCASSVESKRLRAYFCPRQLLVVGIAGAGAAKQPSILLEDR